MRLLLVLLVSVAAAPGAVEGTVTNRTTNRPQAGATVTLYKLGGAGMESLESVKSGADGRFRIAAQPPPGAPSLIQTAFDGVTYNHMLQPGAETANVSLEVFSASTRRGQAQVTQHVILIEPSAEGLSVLETYFFRNDGNTTWNDPEGGTLRFFLPPAANGKVEVLAKAPQGMPIARAAEATRQPGVYKVDFAIKPGESRIDLSYRLPVSGTPKFASRSVWKGTLTRLVAPNGVVLKGANIVREGQEPRTGATIYTVKGDAFEVEVEGSGELRAPADDSGPGIRPIPPRIHKNVGWIVGLSLAILALGFYLMYRSEGKAAR